MRKQDLLLKSQSSNTWGNGALEVLYDANADVVEVWTYAWPQGWVQHGADIAVTFNDGDQFGARAKANGDVNVYKNGTLIATRNVSSWQYYDDGGYIGVWFIDSADAVIDNFGGGQGGQGFTRNGGRVRNRIANQEKDPNPYDVELTNAEIFWQGISLGSELTTKVTFTQLDKTSIRQKPQSNGMWGEDIIQIMYDVPNNRIQVWKFEGKAWVQVGSDIPMKFVDGDVFTVFANKDGTVEIYRAENLLSTRQPVTVQTPTPTVPPSAGHLPRALTPAPLPLGEGVQRTGEGGSGNFVPVSLKLPAPVSAPPQQSGSTITINYVYDPLYRLTEANYSNGDFYHYTYDAVGNRLTQTTQLAVNSYQYDAANRLTSVDSIAYTWDNNGNLLNDGVNAYTYDSANRLISFNGTSSYAYNGLGDRLSQTVNAQTTNYTLDLNTGLTQVLNDGTNTYLYGNGRIAQINTTTEYFLGDALGSVRQLTDASGEITLAKSYAPYGEVTNSAGSAVSPFAFTGEQQDISGLTYLSARYYASYLNQFIQPDTIVPDPRIPADWNKYAYVRNNPVNYTDPSGMTPLIPCPDKNNPECTTKVMVLKSEARRIKDEVESGNLLPVEGFAQFLDATMLKFDNDLGSTMWAATLIINGFDTDANIAWPLWRQAKKGVHLGGGYWIGYDWLPYRHAICSVTVQNWYCSERGDWKKEFWDKTANQAYHGWYFAAEAFFEGTKVAGFANWYHEIYEGDGFEPISPDPAVPPPANGVTAQDYALSLKMMELGYMLSLHYVDSMVYRFPGQCPPDSLDLPTSLRYMSPGAWIRANLKDRSAGGR